MIDCPALHKRCHAQGYPFGDRVPSKIVMRKTVTSDFMWLSPENSGLVAPISVAYDAWTNSYGAVAAIMDDGRKLGVKPGEFEVVEWHNVGT